MSNPTATIRITELYVDSPRNSVTNIPSIDEVYPSTPIEETISNTATSITTLTTERTSEFAQSTNAGNQSIADSPTEIQIHSAAGSPSVSEAIAEFALNHAGESGGGAAYGDGNYGDGDYGEGSGGGDNQTMDEVIT